MAAPAIAEGQSAPLGKVTVQNNYLLTPSQITAALGLKEGAAFDADALKAAVQCSLEHGERHGHPLLPH